MILPLRKRIWLIIASDFKRGDEVFGLAYGGAYAEYIAVSVKMIVHKPKELSFEQCAGIPEVWFTAIQALYLVGGMEKGMSVLFHAGASSNPSVPLLQSPRPSGIFESHNPSHALLSYMCHNSYCPLMTLSCTFLYLRLKKDGS